MKLLLLLAAAVPLFGQTTQCTYKLSAGGVAVSAAASVAGKLPSFTVTTPGTCPFVAVTAATWLHIQAPAKGTNFAGTSQVSFSVDANTSAQLRTDQILIYPGTQVTPDSQSLGYVVAQVAGICDYSLSASSATVPATGGSGSFTVNTGCTWGATTSTFITATAPNGTLGTGPINYQVSANLCAAPRTGLITLQTGLANPPVFQITQDGSLSNFTLSPAGVTDPAGALTNQKVTVTTGAGCPWSAYTDSANWLHPTGASGTGPGVVTYSVDTNQGASRTGHIYFQSGVDLTGNPILAATLTVTQQAIQATGPILAAVVNDASYDIGTPAPISISPGEIVALFGSNLGPVAGVVNTQTFGTSLGGVQVMFGNTAAPLLYVSAGQINAVVPYATGGSECGGDGELQQLEFAGVDGAGAGGDAGDFFLRSLRQRTRRDSESGLQRQLRGAPGRERQRGGDLLHRSGSHCAGIHGWRARHAHSALSEPGRPTGNRDHRRPFGGRSLFRRSARRDQRPDSDRCRRARRVEIGFLGSRGGDDWRRLESGQSLDVRSVNGRASGILWRCENSSWRSSALCIARIAVLTSLLVVPAAVASDVPDFSGVWVETQPESGPPMRLQVTQSGSRLQVRISFRDDYFPDAVFRTATIENGAASWTIPQGCIARFRWLGYNYDNPGLTTFTLSLREPAESGESGPLLVYVQKIHWDVPCASNHPIGTEQVQRILRRR